MRICIDSCVLINGLTGTDVTAVRLLELIGPDLTVVIPRLVAQEVTRNLQTAAQVHQFYQIFYRLYFPLS
jgi:predicted nucleic acid-binding protein